MLAPADGGQLRRVVELTGKAFGVCYRHQEHVFTGRCGKPAVVAGVEMLELRQINVRQTRGLHQVNLGIETDFNEVRIIGDIVEADAIGLGRSDNLRQGEQVWHVGPGLFRQLERPEVGWLASAAVLLNSAAYTTFT